VSSTHPLQTPLRIGATNLFKAPLNALEVAVLVPAAPCSLEICGRSERVSGGRF
jgi:hypothetical protein